MRLGPSASEAAALADEEKVVRVVQSLSHIKDVVSDPNMRQLLHALAPKLLHALGDDQEVERAKNGLPASSRLSKAATPSVRPDPPVIPAPPKMPPAPKKSAAPPAKSPDPSPTSAAGSGDGHGGGGGGVGSGEINSSTHRAAHARLARRMSGCDPVQFPQMAKLWAGTRKERSLFSISYPKKRMGLSSFNGTGFFDLTS